MQEKTVTSINREADAIAGFNNLGDAIRAGFNADATEAQSIQALAKRLADQVAELALPLASKVALVKATYADEFASLASTKDLTKEQAKRKSNAVAGLVAAITCYSAGATPVEVKAPADGKAAEFKPAAELSFSAMKANAAAVKETVKAQEVKAAAEEKLATMTAEEKKAAQDEANAKAAAEAVRIAEAKAKAAKICATSTVQNLAAQLSLILSDAELRGALDAAFLTHGFTLAKAKQAPKTGSMAEQLAGIAK